MMDDNNYTNTNEVDDNNYDLSVDYEPEDTDSEEISRTSLALIGLGVAAVGYAVGTYVVKPAVRAIGKGVKKLFNKNKDDEEEYEDDEVEDDDEVVGEADYEEVEEEEAEKPAPKKKRPTKKKRRR